MCLAFQPMGALKQCGTSPFFCVAIIAYALNFEYWVCFVIPTQSIGDCESMGIEGWSNGYRRSGVSSTTIVVGSQWMFAFNLKELYQLKGQKVKIILEDDNSIFNYIICLMKLTEPWFKPKQQSCQLQVWWNYPRMNTP